MLEHELDDIRRLCDNVELQHPSNAIDALSSVVQLRARVEAVERQVVLHAKTNSSWQDIADRYGVTRQTVFAKFGKRKDSNE